MMVPQINFQNSKFNVINCTNQMKNLEPHISETGFNGRLDDKMQLSFNSSKTLIKFNIFFL